MRRRAVINWSYTGPADLTVGSGATRSEQLIVYVPALLSGVLFIWLWAIQYWSWSWWQYLLVAIQAMDTVGGVVANATNSCKRFYHSEGLPQESAAVRFLKSGQNFELLHVHTIVLTLLLPETNWLPGVIWYGALQGAACLVRRVPLYLSRPTAFLLIMLAILGQQYLLPLGTGLEWVVPLLFLKIVYGHGVQEEPYRPENPPVKTDVPTSA